MNLSSDLSERFGNVPSLDKQQVTGTKKQGTGWSGLG